MAVVVSTFSLKYAKAEDPVKNLETTPQFEKIALCESNNNPLETNPHSTAKGRFQFLDGTWKYYAQQLWGDQWKSKNPFDYQTNTELAWFVYSQYGDSDWDASKNCWSK